MTTIAWDGTTLAVDSQVSMGSDVIDNNAVKLWKNIAGFRAIAACGEWGKVLDMILVLEKATPKDLLKTRPGFSEITLVGLTKKGKLFEYCWNSKGEVHQCEILCSCAWGSGYAYAVSAMDFGKNSKEAVKYSATRDTYTNNIIQSVRA